MGKKKKKKYCIAIFHKKICFTVQINTAYVRIRDIFQNHLKNRNYSTLLRAKAVKHWCQMPLWLCYMSWELIVLVWRALVVCDPAELCSLYLTHLSTFNFSNATPAGYWLLSLSSDRWLKPSQGQHDAHTTELQHTKHSVNLRTDRRRERSKYIANFHCWLTGYINCLGITKKERERESNLFKTNHSNSLPLLH